VAKRTFSTVILWSLVLVCLRYFGATGGVWLITAVSVLTLHEFYAMVERMGFRPFRGLGLILGAAITLAPRYFEPALSATDLLALGVIAAAVRLLGERAPPERVETLAGTILGLVYVPFMLQFLVRIVLIAGPHPHTGLVLGLWLIVVTKFCDTGALLTGLAIGRHQLAPGISPKKSWEGVAGGMLLAVAVGAALAWGCRAWLPVSFTPLFAAVLAVPLAAAGIIADLIESVLKRRADIKDASHTIPGIGGVFDLSDSLILAAPIGWMVFHLL
jgi:phosphatidate cytidylyltransferase